MLTPETFSRRRLIVGACSIVVTLVLAFGFGHTGMHMLQNLLVPGLGLHERSLVLAILVFLSFMTGIVAWIRWGIDWLPLAIVLLSTAASGVPMGTSSHHHAVYPSIDPWVPQVAAHEFPIVVAVVAALIWLQGSLRSVPLIRRLVARKAEQSPETLQELRAVECSQGAVIAMLAGQFTEQATAAAASDKVSTRARRIGQVARLRFAEDPFTVDHGVARAALLITDQLEDTQHRQLAADAAAAPGGVPCCEPGCIRLLNAFLTAVVLERCGDDTVGSRMQAMLAGPLKLRRGHRPAMWWTPLGVSFGNTPLWEHALAAALARHHGWCGDEDWESLRPQLLGAAARGVSVVDDERAIAAGRLWLDVMDDEQASRILMKPTLRHDPIARAIEALRDRLAAETAARRQ